MLGIHPGYIAIFCKTANSAAANPISRVTTGIHHMLDGDVLANVFGLKNLHQY